MTGAYLETIVRTVPDGVVAFNNAGQFIYVNDEAEKILGRKKEEIRSMSYDDPRWRLRSLDGTMLKSEQMPFQAVMSSKSPARDVKFKIERGDGNDAIISMNFSPITSPDKEIDSIVASMTDITELKRGEEKLKEEMKLLTTLMETTPSGIMVLDNEGVVRFANHTAHRVLGREDLVGMRFDDQAWKITDYEGGEFPSDMLPFRLAATKKRLVMGVRHAVNTPDGRRVLLLINAAPMMNKGNVDGAILTMDDVTDSVIAERYAP